MRDRRIFNRRIMGGGAVEADRPGGDDQVADLHPRLDGAGRSDPKKGSDAELGKLFDGDGSRRPADSGGGDENFLSPDLAQKTSILPLPGKLRPLLSAPRFDLRCDFRNAKRIAGKKRQLRPLEHGPGEIEMIDFGHETLPVVDKKGYEPIAPRRWTTISLITVTGER